MAPDRYVAEAQAAAGRLTGDEPTSAGAAAGRVVHLIAVVLLVGVAVRLVFAALIPLFPDEAYYWEWSRRLAAGYFDHPPGIPLLVRAGTTLTGVSSFGVRLFPVVAGLMAAIGATAVAWRIGNTTSALRAALVITCMPLAAAGLVLATPDAPLLATSAVAIYFVVRALQAPLRSGASLGWWSAAGVALGLAFCSKYTSILLPVGVVIALLWRRGLRSRLAEPGPYVACIIAALVFLPVLRWNAAHQWVSFGFQIHHGLAPSTHRDVFAPLKRLGDLVGGQAALVSPILFVLLAIATMRGLRRASSDAAFLLAVVTTFTFLFFCYSATRQRVEANWPAPAYIAAIPLLAAMTMSSPLRTWLKAGIWLGAVMSILIYLHAAFAILPLPPRKDPIGRAAGWDALAASVEDALGRDTLSPGARAWVAAERYQDASELAFHISSHPTTFSLNFSSRGNQFDLWPGFPQRAQRGDDLILALDETAGEHPTIAALAPCFRSFSRDSLVDLRSPQGPVSQRRVWVMHGWTGDWPAR